jgi:hypothetical protein
MKDDQQRFEDFLKQVVSNRQLWLLQADEGQFALLGDDTGSSFIPVWATEVEAKMAIEAEWTGYECTQMGINEFISWLDELHADELFVGLSPDENAKVLALAPLALKEMLLQSIKE